MVQLIINGLVTASVFSLVALSFCLVYRATRVVLLTHAALLTVGAYLSYWCMTVLKMPLPAAIPISIVLAFGIGLSIDAIIYRPLRRSGALSVVLLLTSLGGYVVIQNLVSIVFGDEVRSLQTGRVTEGILVLGARVTGVQLLTIAVSVAALATVWPTMQYSGWGKQLRAISSDPDLASSQGIQVDRVILIASGFSGAMAALVASLVGLDVGIVPTMGLSLLLVGLVALIIGGMSTLRGIMISAVFLGMARQCVTVWLGNQWKDVIVMCILVVFLASKARSRAIGISDSVS